MIRTIDPIVPESQIHTRKGRFSVQLEIPPESTLTAQDIDNILAYASWDRDPNTAEGKEGGRSILISRERPRALKGLELKALQVSGIGSVPMEFRVGSAFSTLPDALLTPPSSDNFMKGLPGTIMTTTRVREGRLYNSKPDYRARGTYTEPELQMKVQKTRKAAKLSLESLTASPLEAVGRYLDDELQDKKGGQFGFMVVPTPSVHQERIMGQIYKTYAHELENAPESLNAQQIFMLLYNICGAALGQIYPALKDLHENGRHVHLQPHLSNMYSMQNGIYMMDWSTLEELRGKPDDRLRARFIDVRIPIQNVQNTFAQALGMNQEAREKIDPVLIELGLELYRGGDDEIKFESLLWRAREAGVQPRDHADVMVQWMRDEGYEGFPNMFPRR